MGDLMAYILAGHHGGLPQGVDLFQRRMKDVHPEWQQFAHEDLLAPVTLHGLWNQKVMPFLQNQRCFGFATAMQIRMLFSALVDADFLATEAFMNPSQQRERPCWPQDILSQMSDTLEQHLAILEEEAPLGNISQLREEIHHSCRENATKQPGVYRLNVPTGGGKTLSSLSFALKHALQHGLHRVIYVIPYTSITEQTATTFRKVFAPLSKELKYDCVLEHHSNITTNRENTRTKLMFENWDSPLIVTTNVQFFESLFAHKTSACRKVHRIARSVVIFDEAQALPTNLLAPCLESMKSLRRDYGNTLVLCTATQPALMYREKFPIGWQENDVQSLLDKEQEAKLEREMKRVHIEHLGTLNTKELIDHFLKRALNSALLIVNTTRQAQDLLDALRAALPEETTPCRHLSARMCPLHRSQVLQEVRSLLNEQKPIILVATRVIEAGVDISFPVVYRDQSGIDSLAQAAGRCNRHGEMPKGGLVYSFESSDYPIPDILVDLKAAANASRDIRDTHPEADILSPDIVRRFFELYYTARGDQTKINGDSLRRWDEQGVLELSCCQYGSPEMLRHIDFPEISHRFQLIPDGQRSIMIPWGKEGENIREELKKRLHKGILPDRKLFQRIHSCSIQIYNQDWIILENEKQLETYADGLVYVLPALIDYYNPNTGFKLMKNYHPNQSLYIC